MTTLFDPHVSPTAPIGADDDFDASAAMRKARRLYEDAIVSLRALASQALSAAPEGDASQLAQDIAALLHNLSGTSAHFGEGEFGQTARSLEHPVRAAPTAETLQLYCRAILAGIDRR